MNSYKRCGVLQIGASLALAAGFAAAAVWSVRVGCADYEARKQTEEATEAAVRWMPAEADYRFRLAAMLGDRDGKRSIEQLQEAARLNAWDARTWIELGLRREAEGNLKEAEQCLLRAADADRLYIPRWTLANFYFRHENPSEFQRWAKAAAEIVNGDASALFRLCDREWEDGSLIDRLEIARPEVRAGYLAYLLGDSRLDRVMPAVRKVMENEREEDAPLLMTACQRLLEKSDAHNTLEIWNRLAVARRIPFGELDPEHGRVLTDGRFEATSVARGFAWMIPGVEGVSASAEGSGGGLRFTFSGSQPEQCEIISQVIPVAADREYAIKWLSRTSQIIAQTGLAWRISDTAGTSVFGEGEVVPSNDEDWREFRFRIPSGYQLARLRLWYGRKPGTGRIAGYLILREVTVQQAT